MKKIIAIVGANLLIAGGLSARASWMILSGCNIDGTCRGSTNMLTWGLAIVPAVILLVVIALSIPMAWKATAARRSERKVMAAEKAEAVIESNAESEQGQSRLARLKRTQEDVAEAMEFEANGHVADQPIDDFDDAFAPDLTDADAPMAVDNAEEIEREWLAAEAAMDPAVTGYMAELNADGILPADLPPAYAIDSDVVLTDMPTYQAPSDPANIDFRLTPLLLDDMDETAEFDTDEDAFTPEPVAETASVEPQIKAHSWSMMGDESDDEDHADPLNSAATDFITSSPAPSYAPVAQADIWANMHSADDDENAPEPIIEPVATLDPINLPHIGRPSAEWSWLFADNLPLLRTSRATGFPWIAGGIGEVANAIRSSITLDGLNNTAAEVDAWCRIADSIPYAETLDPQDAQSFVEWCNTLSIDLVASDQQAAFIDAISDSMSALRGRARNDMETSIALPDAFAHEVDVHGGETRAVGYV